jgi:hypothetical protein
MNTHKDFGPKSEMQSKRERTRRLRQLAQGRIRLGWVPSLHHPQRKGQRRAYDL